MKSNPRVRCEITGVRRAFGSRVVEFSPGIDLRLESTQMLGPWGLSARAADLLDIAASVLWIERSLPGRASTNTPEQFDLQIALRDPNVWTAEAVTALASLLRILGNAVWNIEIGHATKITDSVILPAGAGPADVERVALLSGGMDSACGAAVGSAAADRTRLVSFYTRQQTVQKRIAEQLGYDPPVQFRLAYDHLPGRGRSFFYRSFFFLALAAAVAQSYGVRHIVQAENGILATAIPPSDAWRITRHAHPLMLAELRRLLNVVLGGDWRIENPFLLETKRGALLRADQKVGRALMQEILQGTDTCWFHWSNRVRGGAQKRPGIPCGVCLPCIVRRTAQPEEEVRLDLREDAVRNDPATREPFLSYALFLGEVAEATAEAQFYLLLPPGGRELVESGVVTLGDLHRLFRTFATEFEQTFRLEF